MNRKVWEEKVRKYTAPFQRFGNLYEATATFSANQDTRWFASSDGAGIQASQTYYRLQISAFSKADDGMELPRYESFFAFTPEGLPVGIQIVGRHHDDWGVLQIAHAFETTRNLPALPFANGRVDLLNSNAIRFK